MKKLNSVYEIVNFRNYQIGLLGGGRQWLLYALLLWSCASIWNEYLWLQRTRSGASSSSIEMSVMLVPLLPAEDWSASAAGCTCWNHWTELVNMQTQVCSHKSPRWDGFTHHWTNLHVSQVLRCWIQGKKIW